MKEFWNQRFNETEYAYGINPNEYLKAQLPAKVGKILFPAEGQGRNALFAALHGWDVTAFDYSKVAKQRADELFDSLKVTVDYQVLSYEDMDFEVESFDAIALVYAHMPPVFRKAVHQKLVSYLKKGGVLILEGFSKKQLPLNSGGPKSLDLLYDIALIKSDFSELEIIELKETQVVLEEGQYHQGMAEVIRFVGRK